MCNWMFIHIKAGLNEICTCNFLCLKNICFYEQVTIYWGLDARILMRWKIQRN